MIQSVAIDVEAIENNLALCEDESKLEGMTKLNYIMVNCWFGLVVGILGRTKVTIPFIGESQESKPPTQTSNYPLVEKRNQIKACFCDITFESNIHFFGQGRTIEINERHREKQTK